jgi:hypothetical protein
MSNSLYPGPFHNQVIYPLMHSGSGLRPDAEVATLLSRIETGFKLALKYGSEEKEHELNLRKIGVILSRLTSSGGGSENQTIPLEKLIAELSKEMGADVTGLVLNLFGLNSESEIYRTTELSATALRLLRDSYEFMKEQRELVDDMAPTPESAVKIAQVVAESHLTALTQIISLYKEGYRTKEGNPPRPSIEG